MLDVGVNQFAVYMDTRNVTIICPECGSPRRFSGTCVYSNSPPELSVPLVRRWLYIGEESPGKL